MPPYHTVQVSVESSMAVWGSEDLVRSSAFPAQSWVRRFRGVSSRCDRREFTKMLLEFGGTNFILGQTQEVLLVTLIGLRWSQKYFVQRVKLKPSSSEIRNCGAP